MGGGEPPSGPAASGVPWCPACLEHLRTRSSPAPLGFKVCFWLSRCAPKRSRRAPGAREDSAPGNRPLPAQLSPPPAGSFHFLTAKSPEGRRCRHRRRAADSAPRAPTPAPPTPTISAGDWRARAAAPVHLAHWPGQPVSPTIARLFPRPLKSRPSIGGACGLGAGGSAGSAALGQ